MKQRALAALALIITACAHDDRPAASSAASVERASDVPTNNPDFTPPENQVGDADGGVQTATTGSNGTTTTATNGAAYVPPSGTTSSSNSSSSNTTTSSNGTTTTAPNATAPRAADNSGVNDRDRARTAVTPMDQGESEADRTITQQIRQAVMKDGSLSFNAKNVKIITLNRKVTLRGPVKSDAERAAIEAAAKKVAGVASVDNQLEVAK